MMEEQQLDKDMAVFHQICEVNELNPQEITREIQQHNSGKDLKAERLIWAALDQRARLLLKDTAAGASLKGDKAEYTIDADPAAPAFVVNEEYIRSEYSADTAEKIVEALSHVQLPVQG